MENCRLPIELCELVLDSVREPTRWWDKGSQWSLQDYLARPNDFVVYSHICSAWLPRARRILYERVVLKYSSLFDLFVRSITEKPLLANMVRGLVITVTGSADNYIPIIRATVVARLRQLETLVYDFRDGTMRRWGFPFRYQSLVAFLPITTLTIMSPKDTIWPELLRLIYALRNLQKLHITPGGELRILAPDSCLRRFATMRPSRACTELTTLSLEPVHFLELLPEHAIGRVQQLALWDDRRVSLTSGTLLAQFGRFSSLQELFLHIELFESDEVPAFSRFVSPLLAHLPVQTSLRAITFHITPHNTGYTRRRFIREMSSCKLDERLSKFSHLKSLCLWIGEERYSGFDAERWQILLYDNLPKLRGSVCLSVKIDWDPYGCRWFLPDEDADLPEYNTPHMDRAGPPHYGIPSHREVAKAVMNEALGSCIVS